MAYPRRLLDDQESVTVDLHPHWWFLAAPVSALVVALAVMAIAFFILPTRVHERYLYPFFALGAILLDLEDPRRVIGHLDEPLLVPAEDERDGYVPNVVYSCGSLIHGADLIIPYGFSDLGSGIAAIPLGSILDRLT